jgi:hypothetical protein
MIDKIRVSIYGQWQLKIWWLSQKVVDIVDDIWNASFKYKSILH